MFNFFTYFEENITGPFVWQSDDIIIQSLIYLPFPEICQMRLINRNINQHIINNRNLLINSISQYDISNCRLLFWVCQLHIHDRRQMDPDLFTKCYLEIDKPEVQKDDILKDISRTYSYLPLFERENSAGQQLLYKLLLTITIYDSEMGYCQGMNFVAAMFIIECFNTNLYENNELLLEDCFYFMVGVIEQYKMKLLWTLEMPILPLRVYQLDQLIKKEFPELRQLFLRNDISSDFFASQWFITLFSYIIPYNCIGKIWDLFFTLGWSYFFQLSLALIKLIEQELKRQCPVLTNFRDLPDVSSILKNIKNDLLSNKLDINLIISLSLHYVVTSSELKRYEDQVKDHEVYKYQLVINEYSTEINNLKNKLNTLSQKLTRLQKDIAKVTSIVTNIDIDISETIENKNFLEKEIYSYIGSDEDKLILKQENNIKIDGLNSKLTKLTNDYEISTQYKSTLTDEYSTYIDEKSKYMSSLNDKVALLDSKRKDIIRDFINMETRN